MKKLILCDLDNTLVPLYTQEKFAQIWFSDVAKTFYARGKDPSAAINAMNDGVRAMLLNQGEKCNIDVFYDVVCGKTGEARKSIEPILDEYYATAFANVKAIARENPYAVEIARLMRRKAQYAVIATMPLFPLIACDMRMSWVGLNAGMFDLVTTCDCSSYCKPNPKYFTEILARFGASAGETLMIGNDVREDMEPCESLGIDTFLVTDHLITHGLSYDRFRQGSYPELIAYLESL